MHGARMGDEDGMGVRGEKGVVQTPSFIFISTIKDNHLSVLYVCVTIFLRDGQTDLCQTFRGSSVSAGECFRPKNPQNKAIF